MKTDKLKVRMLFVTLAALHCVGTMAQETAATPDSSGEMELIKRVFVPALTHRSNETSVVSFSTTARPTVPVELLAHRCDFQVKTVESDSRTVQLVEFAIRERDGGKFHWNCWESANSHPHDFRLFVTESGNSYACYVSSEGVKLFHVTENNESDTARRVFREKRVASGELETLRIGFLHEAVGRDKFYSKNALYDPITVDRVFEIDSELRVTIHGNKPDEKFTFALKAGQWRLVKR